MPNWCYTEITINCKNADEAMMLHDKIREWTSFNYCYNRFGERWLGNIVGNSGIDNKTDGKEVFIRCEDSEFSVRCRGSLIHLECPEGGKTLRIDTSTAWSPMLQMWEKICEKYLTEYEILYTADEPGMELFFTNDPNMDGLYIINSDDDEFTRDFLDGESYVNAIDEEDVKNILQDCLGSKEKDIDKLLKMFSKRGYHVWIYSWEYVPISELD